MSRCSTTSGAVKSSHGKHYTINVILQRIEMRQLLITIQSAALLRHVSAMGQSDEL